MLAGSVVVSMVTSKSATWGTLLALLAIHLYMNYMAVRAVSMRSLNRQRANIVLNHLIATEQALTPQQASQKERIFEHDGVLRDQDGRRIGICHIGVSLQTIMRCLAQPTTVTGATIGSGPGLRDVIDLFAEEPYMLWREGENAFITLKSGSTTKDALKAWYHALILANDSTRHDQKEDKDNPTTASDLEKRKLRDVARGLRRVNETFAKHAERLLEASWDLDVAALETKSGTRCDCDGL